MNEERYKIVQGPAEDVSSTVDQMLQEGWQLHGDVHVYTSPSSKMQLVLQAVKRDVEK